MGTRVIPIAPALHLLAQPAGSQVFIVRSERQLASLRSGVVAPLGVERRRGFGCASVSQP
jgi:hypothetical protein